MFTVPLPSGVYPIAVDKYIYINEVRDSHSNSTKSSLYPN